MFWWRFVDDLDASVFDLSRCFGGDLLMFLMYLFSLLVWVLLRRFVDAFVSFSVGVLVVEVC